MIKRINILVTLLIVVFFISGCSINYDPCDANKDGEVTIFEKNSCNSQQQPQTGIQNNNGENSITENKDSAKDCIQKCISEGSQPQKCLQDCQGTQPQTGIQNNNGENSITENKDSAKDCIQKCINENNPPQKCLKDCQGTQQQIGVQGKCGDGVCDEIEKRNNKCPADCTGQSDSGEDVANGIYSGMEAIYYEDSPFGFIDPPTTSFDYYNDLGINWLEFPRENERFGWESVEKQEGIYDFSSQDSEVCKFYQQGINLVYVTRPSNSLYGTGWVEGSQNDEYPDGHLDAWENFIKEVVERYDGDGIDDIACSSKVAIKRYQFVHELGPSNMDYWQNHREEYADVFEATYGAMISACKECTLSMPVPPMNDLKNDGNFTDDILGYLEGKSFNNIGFDYHYWSVDASKGRTDSWKTEGEDYREHVNYIERIESIASKYGFNSNYITSMESGMAGTEESEPKQAGYIIRSYAVSLANGQDKQFWTKVKEYDHHGTDDIIWSHTGLIHSSKNQDGLSHKKLGYYTYKLMVEKLNGSDWDNVKTVINGTDNVYAYKFDKNGEFVWVVWWDYWNSAENSKTVELNVGNTGSVKITEAIPDADSGVDLSASNYPVFFNTETKTVSSGKVSITLGEKPVFVEIQ